MPFFLISFLSLYGGLHAYSFFRLRSTFTPGQPAIALLAWWMILMTTAPLLVRLSERAGMDRCALFIAWPGYLWMGFIFIFVSALLLTDTIRVASWLSNRLFSTSTPSILTSRITCEIALLVAVAASCYACYEAWHIRSEHVVITTTKLPPNIQKIRIVQVSDIHIGLLFNEKRLERIMKIVRDAQPDIFVSTGDLVDGKLNREDDHAHMDKLAAMLASIPSTSGRFAVTGNHEFYADLQQALAFTNTAGFTVLRNQSVHLPTGITITGVDDPAISGDEKEVKISEQTLMESVSKDSFHLLLKHRPDISERSDGLFDLQLSGHVHDGQIFPFNFLVKLRYPIPCGTTITKSGSRIHVSRGTGTWGPPMRLFAPPEVTVIDIVSRNSFKTPVNG
jgi:predicted MPP superfamily phosphohydrolase